MACMPASTARWSTNRAKSGSTISGTTSSKAWYDGGKDDPDILFLRMDLGEAELWDGDMNLKTVAKMAFGMTVHDDVQDKHTDTTL